MNYKWYVVHVYSGSEKRVKETIEEQMKSKNMEEFIEEILVPTEEILEIRKGAKVKTEKKFFPGYLLIKMNMTDESWHFVKSQPKVTNFLGTKGKPIALSSGEASRLIEQITERVERPRSNVIFEIGEEVTITFGDSSTGTTEVLGFDEDETPIILNLGTLTITDGTVNKIRIGDTIVGSKSSAIATVSAAEDLKSEIYSNDEFDDAADFETINDNYLDFSEINPFGEPRDNA